MTNAEKFVEVFGTDIKRQYVTKSWWDQEFVPPKTGYWIIISVGARGVLMKCDKCERLVCTESPGSYTYCPSCGAKMVESEEQA